MAIIAIFPLFVAVLAGYFFFEYRFHKRKLNSIPIRIHVNGTRGKSSVTRLIAAGLRAGGIKAFAKTTGTLPRVITDRGYEFPVFRMHGANIIEQLRIVAFAAENNAEALVIECMALQPALQSMTELKIIRSTHGVITNARPDHLDVMGPSERDVTLALLGTTPVKGTLYTCERDYPKEFEAVCKDRGSKLVIVGTAEIAAITDDEMAGFTYVEHKENVALSLKLCASLGVPRETALKGMYKVEPDAGAMLEYLVNYFGRHIVFINGFAANDPESSETIWRMALDRHRQSKRRIMILNMRADRPDRSRQLGEALVHWPVADRYIVIGTGCDILIQFALKCGMEPHLFTNAEGQTADQIFETVLDISGRSALVMGIGNIKGEGLELTRYFRNRAEPSIDGA